MPEYPSVYLTPPPPPPPPPPDPAEFYSEFDDVDDLVIGLHDVFTYNGLTINDLSVLEHYRLDEITGFEDADLRITDEDNVQEDGSFPGPGLYGSRTMTMSGFIVAGNYPQWLRMRRALLDAFLDLIERPLVIAPKAASVFTHPHVQIHCRKADKVLTPSKIEQKWVTNGVIEAPFTLSLKATDPAYESVLLHEQVITPGSVSFLGRAYDRSYDLSYTQFMDESGDPAAEDPPTVITNAGNWYSMPVLVFSGLQANARLVNVTNGHEVRIKHTIPADTEITIDVATGDVVDAAGENRSDYFDTASDWMRLVGTRDSVDGANDLRLHLSDLDDGSSVTVRWRDRYMA